jgi:spore germination protein
MEKNERLIFQKSVEVQKLFRKTPIESLKEEIKQRFINSTDFKEQSYTVQDQKMELLYLSSVCDEKKIKKEILLPFFQENRSINFEKYFEGLPNISNFQNANEAVKLILKGNAAVFLSKAVFLIDLIQTVNEKPTESTVENTIQGPQLALSENVSTSLTQIRNRYQSPTLKVEKRYLGNLSQTLIYIIYDEELADPETLKILMNRIQKINVDVLIAAGQLEKFINDQKRSLFPTMMITERPDRTTVNLSQGKIAILIDGTPFLLIGPAVFYDFFSAVDDLYQSYFVSRFLVILRYFGLFICLTVPALYVSIASYNPEIFRVQLTISIAGSRAAVPYPSFLEVLFMLGTMELLTEASIRLPKAIGSTATTVGGLILGQAAQQAGLVSAIMIIVVASVAIANFVIPINAMSFSIRITKYILVAFATLFGIVGLVAALVALIIYLCSLRSLGQPYLKLFLFEKHIAKVNQKERL